MAQSIIVDITGAMLKPKSCHSPANSQIIDVILNVTTANTDTGAATVSVGTAADADAFLATIDVKALATTHGTLDTEATNVGTTDLEVLADLPRLMVMARAPERLLLCISKTTTYPKFLRLIGVTYERKQH
jgi:hypothetical protein